MMSLYELAALAWVSTVSATWAALIRHGKAQTPAYGFGLGLLLGPLGVVVCALQTAEKDKAKAIECPDCGVLNAAWHRFCKDCGKTLR